MSATLGSLTVLAFSIRRLNQNLSDVLSTLQNADERVDKRELTSYELQRLEREEKLDERVNRLKDELALQRRITHQATVADELHPMVHNLPHDVIDKKLDYHPDVEVSE
jgi:CII-binding regulator of phage lambda lysogenization HflD